jgi:hypothetical protein
MAKVSATLLSAVTATGAGSGVGVIGITSFTVIITAASVTSGGTVKIQALTPGGAWATIDSRTIAASGDTIVQFDGPFIQLRANLTARTDGTYTVSLIGQNDHEH